MQQTNFLQLGSRDVLRGLLIAVLTPIFYVIQTSLDSGVLTFEWKGIAIAGISGGLAYLLKNVFTSPDISAQNIILPKPKEKDA